MIAKGGDPDRVTSGKTYMVRVPVSYVSFRCSLKKEKITVARLLFKKKKSIHFVSDVFRI
jgi:hypothetical protein